MTAPANTEQATADPGADVGPHPGAEPRGNPAARWLAVLTSLLLLGLSGVAARDLWYHFYGDERIADSWLGETWDFLGSFTADAAAATAGIALTLLGLLLVFFAFKPRPHGFIRVNSPVSMWTRPVDIARKATYTTRNDLGGEQVRTKATRKKVKVEVVDDGSGPALQERVTHSLNTELRALDAPPTVSVKLLPKPANDQPSQRATAPTTQEVSR